MLASFPSPHAPYLAILSYACLLSLGLHPEQHGGDDVHLEGGQPGSEPKHCTSELDNLGPVVAQLFCVSVQAKTMIANQSQLQ